MANCRIEFRRSAEKDLERIDLQELPRIMAALQALATNPISLHQTFNRIGMERTRFWVALKSAFAMTGAIAMIGVSPAPTEGTSSRSTRTVSISGTSLKRGTRY